MRVEITEWDPAKEPDRAVTWTDNEGDPWTFDGHRWGFRRSQGDMAWVGNWEDLCDQEDGALPWSAQVPDFVVKDSGVREEYANGFVRDTEDGKHDFTRLLSIDGLELVPVEMIERWAAHMVKGAEKYGVDNWRKARGQVPRDRFLRSLVRHVVQYVRGDREEDHASAIMFNVAARELVTDE